MKILITGATGFVGNRLVERLIVSGNYEIRVLTRNKEKSKALSSLPVEYYQWNPSRGEIEEQALEGVDAVIHLAGESVAEGRWSADKKEKILSSRVTTTKLLMKTIGNLSKAPQQFISASAIGIYGNRGEEELSASSNHGSGFLADVCKKWEELVLNHEYKTMDSRLIRVGIVLGSGGGALQKMLPPFKAGVGGRLGNGQQYMSWIHIDDLVEQFVYLLENQTVDKVFNGVSPNPVRNSEFTKILGKAVSRPAIFPVPSLGLKIIFGEMSKILLASQKVKPSNFFNNGFKYKFENLKDALQDILKYDNSGERVLKKYQYIKKNREEVFTFFSDEKNLEKITPPYLNFKVLGKDMQELGEGTIIDYELKLYGVPLRWQSKIESFKKQEAFVDTQLKGPYAKWVHSHVFYSVKGGTLMMDEVIYKLPFGILGRLFAGYFVRKDLNKIFNFRKKIINEFYA